MKMEGERRRSKGSFFNFFDWNGKSRKKLFANDPELPEKTEQGNNIDSVAKLEAHMTKLDDKRANSSAKWSSDLSCTSSVTSDDGFGTRAPGVVARLMGLNSLPTSNVAEPSPTPFFGSFLLKETQYDRISPTLNSEYNPMECSDVSMRSQRVQNRPFERFQTESLPPKSAKSFPISHHKLLSPIRNPGFGPRKNTADMVEAAAKIIEASPKANMNGRVPSISLPSVPLRIQDLTQKMEVKTASRPQRSNELVAAENRKGECTSSSRALIFTEKGTSVCLKNKGKSVFSHVGQVKSNAHRKDRAASRSNNNKKQETRPNQTGTRMTKRTSENRTSNMLRQNNLKQNCQTGKESLTLKNSVPDQRGRKVQSKTKVASKPETMSKKMRSVPITEKDKLKITTLKKQPVNGNPRIGKSVAVKCNIEVEELTSSGIDDRKGSMEVVSFTFTSPVKKDINSSANYSLGSVQSDNNKSTPFHGLNIIGADVLGALLEEKLRELTNKVESSKCNMIRDDIFVSTFDAVNTTPEAQRSQCGTQMNNLNHLDNFDCLSTEDSRLTDNLNWQGSVDVEECSSSSNFSQAEKDQYRHPSPVSILEHSFESGSFSNTNADDLLSGETELSDSATSIFTFNAPNWELDYVRNILDNAETMLKDFELGKTSKALAPQLFNQLENQHNGVKQNEEDYLKHERKVLFEFVSECLDSITFIGSYKSWAKLQMVVERKEWLAREICKEMLSWKNMGDSMVDELVDKEMSSRHGKWLDFDVEMFQVGVRIEMEIVTCLVDELVYDVFIL